MKPSLVGNALRFCVAYAAHHFKKCTRWVAVMIFSFLTTTTTTSSAAAAATTTTYHNDPSIDRGIRDVLSSLNFKSGGDPQEIFEDAMRKLDEAQARVPQMNAEELLIWMATMDYLMEEIEKRMKELEN